MALRAPTREEQFEEEVADYRLHRKNFLAKKEAGFPNTAALVREGIMLYRDVGGILALSRVLGYSVSKELADEFAQIRGELFELLEEKLK